MIIGDQENSNLKRGGSSLTLKCHLISNQFNSKVILDSCNHVDSISKWLGRIILGYFGHFHVIKINLHYVSGGTEGWRLRKKE